MSSTGAEEDELGGCVAAVRFRCAWRISLSCCDSLFGGRGTRLAATADIAGRERERERECVCVCVRACERLKSGGYDPRLQRANGFISSQ